MTHTPLYPGSSPFTETETFELGTALAARAEQLAPSAIADIEQLLADLAAAQLPMLAERQILGIVKRKTGLSLADLRAQLADLQRPPPPLASDWRSMLAVNKSGTPIANAQNCLTILRHAPEWQGVLWLSDFDARAWLRAPPPYEKPGNGTWAERPMRDSDEAQILVWIQTHAIAQVKGEHVRAALAVLLDENRWHPIKAWLRSLSWDGVLRCDEWLHRALGVEPIPGYTTEVACAWLISAVARVMKPGCIAKYCLVLEGDQDLGKSSALSILGGPWYSDDIETIGSKDSKQQVAAVWIFELPELVSVRRAQVEAVKAFVSRQVDRYRPPYGHHLVDQRRQCVLAGTTNDYEYLADDTGNVRFWPVTCTRADLAWLADNREQLWAEALTRYDLGERWWLVDTPPPAIGQTDEPTPSPIKIARREQAKRQEYDDFTDKIARWLIAQPTRLTVTVSEIIMDCLDIPDMKDHTRGLQTRVGRILARKIGWAPHTDGAHRWYERPRG